MKQAHWQRAVVRRGAAIALFVLAAAAAAAAQQVRDPVRIDTTSTGSAIGPSLATAGDLSVFAFADGASGGSNTVNVSLSDGRGVSWTLPVRIDQDPGSGLSKFTQRDSAWIVGESIYVAWRDERFGISADVLCFRASHDRGQTWGSEIVLDKAHPPGGNPVREWRMAATRGPSQHLIYILFTVDAGGYEDLYFLASHNSGTSFSKAIPVPRMGTGQFDVDSIALVAKGGVVHAFWQDNRNFPLDDIFYQRSENGGYTWLPADVQLDTSGPLKGDADREMAAAIFGDLVLIAWLEELTDPNNEELRADVSADGGVTWSGDSKVGSYDPVTDEIGSPAVAINASPDATVLLAAWQDDRWGSDEVFAAASDDLGASWRPDHVVSQSGGKLPAFSRTPYASRVLAVSWVSGTYPNQAEVALSHDYGLYWDAPIAVSQDGGPDVEGAAIDFNEHYHNYLCSWLAGDSTVENLFAGGFRDQGLYPQGVFKAGQKVHFEVFRWPTKEPFFGVLLSGALGSFKLPFGDGRETGLAQGLVLSFCIAHIPGIFSGSLTIDGWGKTPDFFFPNSPYFPPGSKLYGTAVSFDPTKVPVDLGAIADVVTITVQ